MSTWNKTAIVFADAERVECALDYLATRNCMTKKRFIVRMITDDMRDRLWYADASGSDLWIVALRQTSTGNCVLKSAPLALMGEALPPMRTRPMIASLCALLACRGAFSSLEDSAHMFVAADGSGGYQVTGLTITEGDYVVWPFQEDRFREPSLEMSDEDANRGCDALREIGFDLKYVRAAAAKEFICRAADISEAEISNNVLYNMIDGDRAVVSRGWKVLVYERPDRDGRTILPTETDAMPDESQDPIAQERDGNSILCPNCNGSGVAEFRFPGSGEVIAKLYGATEEDLEQIRNAPPFKCVCSVCSGSGKIPAT